MGTASAFATSDRASTRSIGAVGEATYESTLNSASALIANYFMPQLITALGSRYDEKESLRAAHTALRIADSGNSGIEALLQYHTPNPEPICAVNRLLKLLRRPFETSQEPETPEPEEEEKDE